MNDQFDYIDPDEESLPSIRDIERSMARLAIQAGRRILAECEEKAS